MTALAHFNGATATRATKQGAFCGTLLLPAPVAAPLAAADLGWRKRSAFTFSHPVTFLAESIRTCRSSARPSRGFCKKAPSPATVLDRFGRWGFPRRGVVSGYHNSWGTSGSLDLFAPQRKCSPCGLLSLIFFSYKEYLQNSDILRLHRMYVLIVARTCDQYILQN